MDTDFLRPINTTLSTLFKQFLLIFGLVFAFFAPCYAEKIDFYLTGGPAITKLKNTNSVAINHFVVNNYNTHQDAVWGGILGVGVGHVFQHLFNHPIDVSLGVADYSINLGRVQGVEQPFVNDSNFDTLNYKFNAKSNALMIESKLFYTLQKWKIFGLAGIGHAWNDLYNYSETPTDPNASAAMVPQLFSSHTQNAFAYELGIGVQHELFKDTQHKIQYAGSIDYRYFRLGKGELGSFPAQTTSDRLCINNLYTQGILFSLNVSLS